ncbi:MAG: hypothetical protein P4M09_12770 [Devosia sp.]|nr:hypothetical protein [Devosia sp.]
MRLLALTALVLTALSPALPAAAGPLPTHVGQCTTTTIKAVETRLEGVADSGDAVEYANGGYGVSYDQVPGLHSARKGDKVTLCLTSLPTDCPKGDDRGKTYKATDMRTHKSWELPDAEHMCGGA